MFARENPVRDGLTPVGFARDCPGRDGPSRDGSGTLTAEEIKSRIVRKEDKVPLT